MKRYIYPIVAILLGLSITTMTACFPTAKNESEFDTISTVNLNSTSDTIESTTDTSIIDLPKHITDNEIKNLNIDAVVSVPDGFDFSKKLSCADAKCKKWNGDAVISELATNNLINEKKVLKMTSSENSSEEDMIYSYTLEDDASVSLYTGGIMYRSKKYIESSYSYYCDFYIKHFNDTLDNTLDDMFGKRDIASIDKSKAKNDTEKVLSILDLNSKVGNAEIYSMTSDDIQAITEQKGVPLDKNGKESKPFTEEDDAYLVIYPVEYNKIPSTSIMATGENESLECSKIFFIYSKSGIIGFEISGLFDEDKYSEEGTPISPLDACNKLKDFYNSIITDSLVNISEIKLVFINRRNFLTNDILNCKVEPVWLIHGNYKASYKDGKDTEDEYLSYISALTGEIIPISSIGG